eukprot:scaffold11391_cov70-Phaeocystis_antarctica.AAC.1
MVPKATSSQVTVDRCAAETARGGSRESGRPSAGAQENRCRGCCASSESESSTLSSGTKLEG